jgi:hypothetical protein
MRTSSAAWPCISRATSTRLIRKAISDAIGITSLSDGEELAQDLARWLLRDDADNSRRIGQFLSGISDMGKRLGPARPADAPRPAFPEGAVCESSDPKYETSFPAPLARLFLRHAG